MYYVVIFVILVILYLNLKYLKYNESFLYLVQKFLFNDINFFMKTKCIFLVI